MITDSQKVDHAIIQTVAAHAFDVLDRLMHGCSNIELSNRSIGLIDFWNDVIDIMKTPSNADAVVIDKILPQVYVAIDDWLDYVTPIKSLLIEARKCLPDWAPHSFTQQVRNI